MTNPNPAIPNHKREDLRQGDPHYPRGSQPTYGPDHYDVAEWKRMRNKPTLESHGFYTPLEQSKQGLWERMKERFVRDRHH